MLQKNHRVIALVRQHSVYKVSSGTEIIVANPFDAKSFEHAIPAGAVFIQLLGVSHPSPKEAQQFRDIDLRSVKASADAAAMAGVSHFIYVSVAMAPSGLMKTFQDVRREGEEYCLSKKMNCTFIRPWYVLGPGHWWPLLLLPFYGLAELVPSWRAKARSKALVTIEQMITTLVKAVEADPLPQRIMEIKDIRSR
jgi:uncharacterized protein YbjT (DUF2867 family)